MGDMNKLPNALLGHIKSFAAPGVLEVNKRFHAIVLNDQTAVNFMKQRLTEIRAVLTELDEERQQIPKKLKVLQSEKVALIKALAANAAKITDADRKRVMGSIEGDFTKVKERLKTLADTARRKALDLHNAHEKLVAVVAKYAKDDEDNFKKHVGITREDAQKLDKDLLTVKSLLINRAEILPKSFTL